jgi:hypothetical protein
MGHKEDILSALKRKKSGRFFLLEPEIFSCYSVRIFGTFWDIRAVVFSPANPTPVDCDLLPGLAPAFSETA